MPADSIREPRIVLFADILTGFGGIETYLDALARTLLAEGRRFSIAVSPNSPSPFLDELEDLGVEIYRQPYVPGDRWHVRQRLLVRHVARGLRPGDWVYCVRQPTPAVYLPLVRAAHRAGARVGASWMFAPEFLPPPGGRLGRKFCLAVSETDAVISVSECCATQYSPTYGYAGNVCVVRYHNRQLFETPVPMPSAPPYSIGFIGRIDIQQKNLDTILAAFAQLRNERRDIKLNIYGGGPDEARLQRMIADAALEESVHLHGPYTHDRDLPHIIGENHLFVYTSRFEGGPCFSLLELMQAGRYVVASPVGGIPDLYEDRPELGLLVEPSSKEAVAGGLREGLRRVQSGAIDANMICRRYRAEFSNNVAHQQFLAALNLKSRPPMEASAYLRLDCPQ